jgi:hypothetical protein
VGIVEITGGAPGAEVSVNGRVVGAMPITHVRARGRRSRRDRGLARGLPPRDARGARRAGTHREVARDARSRARRSSGGGGGSDDWILPVAIVGGVLVVAGVTTALAVALQPGYEHSDVGGVVMTLRLP